MKIERSEKVGPCLIEFPSCRVVKNVLDQKLIVAKILDAGVKEVPLGIVVSRVDRGRDWVAV